MFGFPWLKCFWNKKINNWKEYAKVAQRLFLDLFPMDLNSYVFVFPFLKCFQVKESTIGNEVPFPYWNTPEKRKKQNVFLFYFIENVSIRKETTSVSEVPFRMYFLLKMFLKCNVPFRISFVFSFLKMFLKPKKTKSICNVPFRKCLCFFH